MIELIIIGILAVVGLAVTLVILSFFTTWLKALLAKALFRMIFESATTHASVRIFASIGMPSSERSSKEVLSRNFPKALS